MNLFLIYNRMFDLQKSLSLDLVIADKKENGMEQLAWHRVHLLIL